MAGFDQDILDFYQTTYGRAPDNAGYNYWVGEKTKGNDWLTAATAAAKDPVNIAKNQRITTDMSTLFPANNKSLYTPTQASNSDATRLLQEYYKNTVGRQANKMDLDYWLSEDAHPPGVNNFDLGYGSDFDLSDDILKWLGTDAGKAANAFGAQPPGRTTRLRNEGGGGMGGGMGGGGSSGGSGLDAYLNPYRKEVLDTSLRELGKQGEIRRNSLGAEAFSAGAFGDARHGVEGASLTDDLMRAAGDLTSQVNAQGFESAMGWMNTDLDRQMQIALSNAGFDGQQADRTLTAAQAGNTLLTGNLDNTLRYADLLSGLDTSDRNWNQQGLNAQFQDFWDAQGWDRNQLEGFLNLLNSMPGQTGSATSTPNNDNWAAFGSSLGGIDWSNLLGGKSGIASVSRGR